MADPLIVLIGATLPYAPASYLFEDTSERATRPTVKESPPPALVAWFDRISLS
ncbi:MAG: hypothetical protein ACRDPM_07610 [Solirubrobacteraceae bacterium]